MGDFLSSPREKASTSLYDMLKTGKSPFDETITGATNDAITGIRSATERGIAQTGRDTASRAMSSGVTYGAGVEDLINKGTSEIRATGQGLESQARAAGGETKARIGASLFGTALEELSDSSSLGDILAALQTVTGIGTGILTGLGPGGLGLFGNSLFQDDYDSGKKVDIVGQLPRRT
jgi:hypothetical protein